MKKIILPIAILAAVAAFGQQTDSVKTKSIDDVILNAYIRKNSESTNKMPLKPIENPQVYSSVDKAVLQNQIIFTVDDAYRNVTGLQKMWSATGRSGDGGAYVTMRGFISASSMRDGFVSPVTGTIDAVNIEKIEVLKGPSATMFGSTVSSYGGVINRVTKKPFEDFAANISAFAGAYNLYRLQADINTPITNDKKLLFRVNTAYTNTGTFQLPDAKNSYYAFAPTLTYKANDKLEFNVQYELFKSRATPEQMIFYLSDALGSNNMKDLERRGLDYKQYYTGSGIYGNSEVNNIFGQMNYKFLPWLSSSTNITKAFSYSDGFSPYFGISLDKTGALLMGRSDQSTKDSRKNWFQVQQNFNFDNKWGNAQRNRAVLGFDYMHTKDDELFFYPATADGFIDHVPLRGYNYSTFNRGFLENFYAQNVPSDYISKGKQDTYSFYVSDVLTPVKNLNLMASVRYESNHFLGGSIWTLSNATQPYKQAAWSPKFGVVYQIVPEKFSVFGNYQNSFKSNGYYTNDISGTVALAAPERANQYEGGFKANLFNSRMNASLSYYNIQVKNSLLATGQYTASFQSVQVQSGELVSKGVELEVNAYLVRGFSLIGGISYNDSHVTKNPVDATQIGTRPYTAGSPWIGNLNASYQFLEGNLSGFGFGAGVNYANDNYINKDFYLNKYIVVNANIYYEAKKFRIGLKADNLANEHYWYGYTTGNAQPLRTIVANFAYKF